MISGLLRSKIVWQNRLAKSFANQYVDVQIKVSAVKSFLSLVSLLMAFFDPNNVQQVYNETILFAASNFLESGWKAKQYVQE